MVGRYRATIEGMNTLHGIVIDCDGLKNLTKITKTDIFKLVAKIKSISVELGLRYEIECLQISLDNETLYQKMMKNYFNIKFRSLSLLELKNVMNKVYRDDDKIVIYLTGHSGTINEDPLSMDEFNFHNDDIRYLLNPENKCFDTGNDTDMEFRNFCENNLLTEDIFYDLFLLSQSDQKNIKDKFRSQEVVQFLTSRDYFLDEDDDGGEGEGKEDDDDNIGDNNSSQSMNELFLMYSKPLTINKAFRFDTMNNKQTEMKVAFLRSYDLPSTIPFITPSWSQSSGELIELWLNFVDSQAFDKRFWFKTKTGKVFNEGDSRYDAESEAYDKISWLDYIGVMKIKYPYLGGFVKIASYYDSYSKCIIHPFTEKNIHEIHRFIVQRNRDTYICLGLDGKKKFNDDLIKQHIIDKIPPKVRTLCIADICYSGSIFDLNHQYDPMNKSWICERYINESTKDIYSISACSDYELSYKNRYGFFTTAVHGELDNPMIDKNIMKRFLFDDLKDTEILNTLFADLQTNNRIIYLLNNSYRDTNIIPIPELQTLRGYQNGTLLDETNIKSFVQVISKALSIKNVTQSISLLTNLIHEAIRMRDNQKYILGIVFNGLILLTILKYL